MAQGNGGRGIGRYIELFITFFKVGAVTFGGGYSMLPILEHEVQNKKKWVGKDELLDYFALGQTLPGIIAVNVSTFCGSRVAGVAGAVSAVLGVIAPSIIVISVIAAFIANFAEVPIVQKILFGMNVGVAAVLANSALGLIKKAAVDPITAVLALACFALAAFVNVQSSLLLLAAVVVGLVVKGALAPKKGA